MVCKLLISWATVSEYIKRRHSPRSVKIRPFLLPKVQHFNLFHSRAAHLQLRHSPITALCEAAQPSTLTSVEIFYGILICIFRDFHQLQPRPFERILNTLNPYGSCRNTWHWCTKTRWSFWTHLFLYSYLTTVFPLFGVSAGQWSSIRKRTSGEGLRHVYCQFSLTGCK